VDTITAGRETRFDIAALLRSEFATEGLFTPATIEIAYGDWLAGRQESFERAQLATDDMAALLGQSWRDWDVSNSDLHQIWRTLDDLNGRELDHVMSALSPAQLERWIAEMGHSLNGLSRDEKQQIFAMLAANASGESLARIHRAIVTTSGIEDGFDFGTAIHTHSPEHVIVDFVSIVVTAGLAEHSFSHLAPGLAVSAITSDEAATEVTRLLADVDGAAALLLADAVLAEESKPGTVSAIASVLARTRDGQSRARLFASLSGTATDRDGALAAVLQSRGRSIEQIEHTRMEALSTATRLLVTDPDSVIQRLATTLDPDGLLMTAYWYEMVEDDRAGDIAAVLDSLRRGDWVDLGRFSEIGPNPDYCHPNARNLAFAAGTLVNAFTAQADKTAGDIDAIARIAGLVITAAGLRPGIPNMAESGSSSGTDYLLAWHADKTKDNINAALAALIDRATLRLQPLEKPVTGPPGYGGAMRAWSDMYLRLVRNG
jgi:hypothetical protein